MQKCSKLILPFIVVTAYAVSISSLAEDSQIGRCIQTGKACSDVDMDHPKAKEAYEAGCNSKDFYSCARLGQYYEVKMKDPKRALTYYDSACAGKDKYGCDGAYEIYMDLCYLKNERSYCGKKDPKGEFRILAFLETFDSKYEDAFVAHNFESPWIHEKCRISSKRATRFPSSRASVRPSRSTVAEPDIHWLPMVRQDFISDLFFFDKIPLQG